MFVRAENLSVPEVRKNLVLRGLNPIGFFRVEIACLKMCFAKRKKKIARGFEQAQVDRSLATNQAVL